MTGERQRRPLLAIALWLSIPAVALAVFLAQPYLERRRAEEHAARVKAAIIPNDMLNAADVESGRNVAHGCAACHTFVPDGPKKVGPTLFGVVGRPIAGLDGYEYSHALEAHAGKIWTTDELDAWIHDPSGYAPGTKMSFGGLLDPQDRWDLIAYLITLQDPQ
jgi:cytochrome c